MKLVYIAGKLNSDAVGYIKNMHAMCTVADSARRQGFAVVVPCLDFIMGIMYGDYEYRDYFDNNMILMERCDALLICPDWTTSEGTKREIARAEELGIPVFYSLEGLVEWRSSQLRVHCPRRHRADP